MGTHPVCTTLPTTLVVVRVLALGFEEVGAALVLRRRRELFHPLLLRLGYLVCHRTRFDAT